MAQVPQEQWDRVYRELTQRLPSRSRLRWLDQADTPVDTLAGMVLNADANTHAMFVKELAALGHPETLQLLNQLAGGDPARYPDRADDIELAQAILADISTPVKTVAAAPRRVAAPTQVADTREQSAHTEVNWLRDDNMRLRQEAAAVLPAVVEAPSMNGAAPPKSTGELIGQAYDALEALRLADALPIENRAPLAALIAVLQTKNGSQV